MKDNIKLQPLNPETAALLAIIALGERELYEGKLVDLEDVISRLRLKFPLSGR
ncbi:MAG: hypothetical protein ABJB01_05160 [Rudaea sp.]